jgi:hypothetical protein
MEGASPVDDPGTARPEVRAEGLGCPSPARHGTSWFPGRQIVVQLVAHFYSRTSFAALPRSAASGKRRKRDKFL